MEQNLSRESMEQKPEVYSPPHLPVNNSFAIIKHFLKGPIS